MEKYILAFDIGTTSIKGGIIDPKNFKIIRKSSIKPIIYYPKSGWAEQDAEKLWDQISSISKRVLEESEIEVNNISAVIYTAHMAGVLPVDKGGNPLRNIIIWLDERASGLPREVWSGYLKIQGYNLFRLLRFLRVTGGAPSKTGKDPISKIIWIREYEPDVYNHTFKFLDVKGYLIYKSTNSMVTSHDEANLTWLADTRNKRAIWDSKLLRDYNLSREMFPEIMNSTDLAGKLSKKAAEDLGLKEEIPVIVGSGDLTAAAVGSGAIGDGEIHVYIGTSNWIAAHINKRKVDISHYIGSLLSGIPNKYLLIAEQEVAAGALEWAMEILGYKKDDYKKVEEDVKRSRIGAGKLIFFPWLYGERSPIDDPFIRGGLINFTFTHSKGDILRAIMEGVAFNIKWAYQYFQKIIGYSEEINIVGGGALFDVWCQILSDILGIRLKRIMNPGDAGLRGSATIATLALGIYNDFEDAVSRYEIDKVFEPSLSASDIYNELFHVYSRFYKKNRDLYKLLNKHT